MSPVARRYFKAFAYSCLAAVVVGIAMRLMLGGGDWPWPVVIVVSAVIVGSAYWLVGRRVEEWVRYGPRPEPKQWNEDDEW